MDVATAEPERLRTDAETLRKLATGLGRLGAWSVDLGSGQITWSDEVCAIHDVPAGYRCTREEALQFYAPEHRGTIRGAFERCIQHGHPFDVQLRIATRRRQNVWVRAIGQPAYDEDGAIVRVHGAFQDITPLVQVAEEKRLLGERLATTLENMTEGFMMVDREWRLTYLNAHAERDVKMSRKDILGRNFWEIFPEAVGSTFYREYHRAVQTNQVVEFEEYYPPLDLWAQVRAYPSAVGLAISFRDVSQRRRAEQEVLRLNAELEERVLERTAELQEANHELESFAYAVAHDLRTPLCAARAFGRAMERSEGGRLSAEGAEYLRNLRDSMQYMDDMTQSLLALARLSKAAVRREPIDLAKLARTVFGVLKQQDPARELELHVQENLVVEADRVLVTEVLMNLLGNAWKFTRHTAGARIEVGAGTGSEGERVFHVRDNGAGFDMHAARRLFEPFVRLHGQGEFEGTGVGLATVHKIISRHDGRVWVDAAVGRGATFCFTLGKQAASIPSAE